MPITENMPKIWDVKLGYNADTNEIPNEGVSSSNKASFELLFPILTQIPTSAGGLPPDRLDFNGLFKLIGDNVYFLQHGGQYTWQENISYDEGAIIVYNNRWYRSLVDSNLGNNPQTENSPVWTVYLDPAQSNDAFTNLITLGKIVDKINGSNNVQDNATQEELATQLSKTLASIAQAAKINYENAWGALQDFAQGLSATQATITNVLTVKNVNSTSGGVVDFKNVNTFEVPTPQDGEGFSDKRAVNIEYLHTHGGGGSGGVGSNNVMPPNPLAPAQGAVSIAVTATFTASEYRNNFGTRDPRANRQFQVRQADALNWDTPTIDKVINADSLTLEYSERLNGTTQYQWRCRDISEWGQVGSWSDVTTFTTDEDAGIATPTLTVEGAPSDVPEMPLLQGSEFQIVHGGEDIHKATNWRIERGLDGVLVWESANDTQNLTAITVPADTLTESVQYVFKMQYIGKTLGASNWVQVVATCKAQFVSVLTPQITVTGAPSNVPETPTISGSAFTVTTGYSDTHLSTDFRIEDASTNLTTWNADNQTGKNLTSITVPKAVLTEGKSYNFKMRYRGATYGFSAWASVQGATKAQFTYISTPSLTVEGAPNNVPERPTLTASAFTVISDTGEVDAHQSTDWEILKTSDGSSVWQSLADINNLTSITLPSKILQTSTAYRFRVRFNGAKFGSSEWQEVQGTTASQFIYIAAPILSVQGAPNDVPERPTLNGGAFTVVSNDGSGQDTHQASDWQVTRVSDGATIWESLNDTSNLTTARVPGSLLNINTQYKFRCRYQGASYGWSNWTEVTATTAAMFSPITTPDLNVEQDELGVYQAPLLRGSTYVTDGGETDYHSATDWKITTDLAGNEITWSSLSDQIHLTYITVTPNILQSSTNYYFWVRYQGAVSGWSAWRMMTGKTQAVFYDVNNPELLNANIDRAGVNSRFEFSLSQLYVRPGKTRPRYLRLKIYNNTNQNYITQQTIAINENNYYVINDSDSVEFANGDDIDFQVFYKSDSANDDNNAVSTVATRKSTINEDILIFLEGITYSQYHVSKNPTIRISFNYGPNEFTVNKVDWRIRDVNDTVDVWSSLNDTTNLNSIKVTQDLDRLTDYILKIKAYGIFNDEPAETEDFILPIRTLPNSGIGTPGEMGFGVGVCPFEDSVLSAMGLTPMLGYDDENNENYGNYQHSNGSIMVWVPAFAFKQQTSGDNFNMHGENALEIIGIDDFQTQEDANRLGFTVPRAYINGGQLVPGFFIDKYLCSRGTNGASAVAVSVKNGKTISLTGASSGWTTSGGMSGCQGNQFDAITLSKQRGAQYNTETCFMAAAIAILSMVHGQYARLNNNTAACAWLDTSGTNNFPKGCNNGNLQDVNDTSVVYTTCGDNTRQKPLTGSASPFEKTSHNGQACGIADVNGCMWQVTFGFSYLSGFKILQETVKHADITTSNIQTASLYEACTPQSNGRWGNGNTSALYFDQSGPNRALSGVYPKSGGSSSKGSNQYGQDYCGLYGNSVLWVGGYWRDASDAGVFARSLYNYWTNGGSGTGFRAAAYVNATL